MRSPHLFKLKLEKIVKISGKMEFKPTMELKLIDISDDDEEPSLVAFGWIKTKYALRQSGSMPMAILNGEPLR